VQKITALSSGDVAKTVDPEQNFVQLMVSKLRCKMCMQASIKNYRVLAIFTKYYNKGMLLQIKPNLNSKEIAKQLKYWGGWQKSKMLFLKRLYWKLVVPLVLNLHSA
jgi:hypothetical protein